MFAIAYPEIDPIALQLGPLAVRWYGLAYFAGILLGWWYVRRLVADERLWGGRPAPMTLAHVDDLLLWMTVGIIVGGRLGNVIFYDPAYYLRDPLAALRVWEGGMAFHGGLLGTIIAMIIFGARRGVPVLSLFDVTAAATPIGLFFGRVANFINGELYGRPSDAPWAMVFPAGGPAPRHPSQLYEAALEGILLFAFLRLLTHRFGSLRRPGLTGGAFIAGYGICRIFVEFYREPDPELERLTGFLTMGMVLSLPMVAVGLGAVLWAMRRKLA
ncbi:MAG: prolipoprotein diacylglyceryl transferase [Rhizobiales bacterium]|nr:prolipoprotein diacylglyceryl transferase [Hyphomicrobiales bacterium]